MAAYQYKTGGNQVWLTFDSSTTLQFDVERSGKDKDHENFIDRGNGIADYGWYNLDSGESGSFLNSAVITFNENDRIGLYVTDNEGQVFTTTKKTGDANLGDDVLWGHANTKDGSIALYGGNNGSNGTHEYYAFKVSTANAAGDRVPSGQPLPGIVATLLVGGGTLIYLKKRRKLYAAK
ncbi:MAG: hypothetical protein J6S21_02060 [Victivallales bacterium]|nr:hypothetical protein [Victivallales bacterium]